MASSTASRRRRAAARALIAAAALATVSFTAPPAALAEPAAERDPKLAQSLFDRARTLMDQGQFAEACPLLAESQRLDPGGGALLNLAVCLEQAGLLASAHATFNEALSQAIKDGREDRKRLAEERIAQLAPRLSTLTIDVPAAIRVPGMIVWLDGSKLSEVVWGIPHAVDGGEHRIEATAPERAPFHATRAVAREGEAALVTIEVPLPPPDAPPRTPAPLPPCGPAPELAAAPCVAEPARARVAPPVAAPARRTTLSPASRTLGVVGVALAATTIATGVAALVLDDQAEKDALADGCNLARHYCPAGHTTSATSTAATSHALGWIATGAAVTSGIALLTALVLPRSKIPIAVHGAAARDAGWIGVEASF